MATFTNENAYLLLLQHRILQFVTTKEVHCSVEPAAKKQRYRINMNFFEKSFLCYSFILFNKRGYFAKFY